MLKDTVGGPFADHAHDALRLRASSRATIERSRELCALASALMQDVALTLESSRRLHRSLNRVAGGGDVLDSELPPPTAVEGAERARATFTCKAYACSAAARFQVCVVATIGSSEVRTQRLQLYVCEEHRADYALAIQTPRLKTYFRRQFSRDVGTKVKLRSLRVAFIPIPGDSR